MSQKIITNDERTRFYCWGWDWFFPLRKLGRQCFCGTCRFMYVPALPHYRKELRFAGGDARTTRAA